MMTNSIAVNAPQICLDQSEALLHPQQEFTIGRLECALKCENPEGAMTIDNLCASYSGHTVLRDVSVTLNKGCITALIGPSGCGKSTFLSCLNRMIETVPGHRVSGSVRLNGVDIRARNVDLRTVRRDVGMVFQRPNPFPFSIRRNFEIPLLEHGIRDRHEMDERMESALRAVGLWQEVKDKLDKSALALSGGQQQRLCIARATILEPTVLLMDEPCSALDPISSAMVEELILGMKNRYTVVIVTHNLAQARRISNYVAMFWVNNNSGELIEFGTCDQVFARSCNTITANYVAGVLG